MGCEFDFAIDMWSFGCIIYEIITSNVLFKSTIVQMNFCKAAALSGTTDFSIFKRGIQYKKYVLKDKYICMVTAPVPLKSDKQNQRRLRIGCSAEREIAEFVVVETHEQ